MLSMDDLKGGCISKARWQSLFALRIFYLMKKLQADVGASSVLLLSDFTNLFAIWQQVSKLFSGKEKQETLRGFLLFHFDIIISFQ